MNIQSKFQTILSLGESIPVVNILFQNLEEFLPTAAPDFR